MFNDADQLKAQIRALSPEDFFDQHLSGGHSRHFDEHRLAHFCKAFSANFGVDLSPDFVTMVGSGKLGFAIQDKAKGGVTLKAFRPYRPGSDIDMTICHPELFKRIWFELSTHACLQHYMPWRHYNLADYLLYGWLRPDKFPKGANLTHCDKFYETVGDLKRDRVRGHPLISVALFFSVEQLKRYQTKGIRACKARLEEV
jgi:hypothetical protein